MPRQIVYAGRRIQVAVETLSDNPLVTKEVVLHPGAVAILPLLDAETLVLIQNRRVSIGRTLLEIPAGTLEPSESPEAAAPRELAEETGFRAARIRKLADFFPSPGVLSERMHLFLAEDLTRGDMKLEADEEVEPKVVPWKDALKWAIEGTIQDAKTLVAILLWEHLRKERS